MHDMAAREGITHRRGFLNRADSASIIAEMSEIAFDTLVLRRVMHRFHDGLAAHCQALNDLNVYPVPDGDTGTNMMLTMRSVTDGINGVSDDMQSLCDAIAHATLMGARGNSGVILAEIMRGITSVLDDAAANRRPVNAPVVAQALVNASDKAYAAVARPVEGTILTVIREVSESARKAADAGAGLVEMLETAQEQGHDTLQRTPQMLDVLAEAGVVDAGGAGLLLLLDACLCELDGRPMPDAPTSPTGDTSRAGASSPQAAATSSAAHPAYRVHPTGHPDHATGQEFSVADLRYEVMFLLDAPDEAVDGFKSDWQDVGDSIVVVGGKGLWNCHIHTDDIGAAIEAGIAVGRPHRIQVTDLFEQAAEHSMHLHATGDSGCASATADTDIGAVASRDAGAVAGRDTGAVAGRDTGAVAGRDTGAVAGSDTGAVAGRDTGTVASTDTGATDSAAADTTHGADKIPAPVAISDPDRCALVAVGEGPGVAEILTSMGVSRVVAGGQSMNPSTAELIAAVNSLPAGRVLLLPNNKNIIPVAQRVNGETQREVHVVPTRNVMEGIASLVAFSSHETITKNAEQMHRVVEATTTGEVTQAVRDASTQVGPVRAGDWLGVGPDAITSVASEVGTAATTLLDRIIIRADHELLTVITGADADDATTAVIEAHMSRCHPEVQVEVQYGGQPLYPYYFGFE